MLVPRGLELPLLHRHIENEPQSAIDQRGHDSHQGNHLGPAQTSDRGFPQDGIVVLKRAVGSFRSGGGDLDTAREFPIKVLLRPRQSSR